MDTFLMYNHIDEMGEEMPANWEQLMAEDEPWLDLFSGDELVPDEVRDLELAEQFGL